MRQQFVQPVRNPSTGRANPQRAGALHAIPRIARRPPNEEAAKRGTASRGVNSLERDHDPDGDPQAAFLKADSHA